MFPCMATKSYIATPQMSMILKEILMKIFNKLAIWLNENKLTLNK
jgi:hypothetical protein